MFIAKIEYAYDNDYELKTDVILLAAKDWHEAMNEILECYQVDLSAILYLEPWESMVVIDDDFFSDIEKIKNGR